jgi:small subunit ribosomal protein S1
MQVTLSQFAGFCDGVKRAYEIVTALADKDIKRPVFVLGSLVHNQDVVDRIEKMGIKKIGLEEFRDSKKGEIGTIIVTAHGIGPWLYEHARKNEVDVIDTTCPKVIKVQRLAKYFAGKGATVVLVGDREHKEVKGIDQWSGGKSFIVSSETDIEDLSIEPSEKVILLSQTTQNQDNVRIIYEKLKSKFPDVEMIDTVCSTTYDRQKEVEKLAKKNQVVLVIGSPESANSTRLFEIARRANPRTYFVENASGILPQWLDEAETVAVTAGASSPDWVIEEVLSSIG